MQRTSFHSWSVLRMQEELSAASSRQETDGLRLDFLFNFSTGITSDHGDLHPFRVCGCATEEFARD